ncbi:MAG: SDR family NAD(P)-dependent oxidoreductase, partial [Hyphomonadaceae bacterium]
MKKLKGKVAAVTGAGGGMGRAYAHRLAQLGADVAILDIDLNVAKRWKEELQADTVMDELRAMGVRSIGVEADLSKRDQVFAAIETVVRDLGGLDILVNNAGGAITDIQQSFASISPPEDTERLMDANFRTTLNCCQAAIPHLKARKGVIVNVTTVGVDADDVQARNALYAAAKAAVLRYSKSLAVELGPDGVRVNCIAPGGMATARIKAMAAVRNLVTADSAKNIPLRRLGTAEDIAGAMEFLVTDMSAYVTGECIRVSGGA